MTAGKKLGIGFIGAAEIAKKNARAISLANCDIGEPLATPQCHMT